MIRKVPRRESSDRQGAARPRGRLSCAAPLLLALAACGADDAPAEEAPDAGDELMDASIDAGRGDDLLDATVPADDASATTEDGGTTDAGVTSGVGVDAGGDAGSADAGPADDGSVDAGSSPPVDAGPPPPPPSVNAPVISLAGYFSDAAGARLLVRGSDPDGDVASYTLAFFNDDQPVAVDIDGQGSPRSSFTGDVPHEASENDFSLSLDLSSELAASVDAMTLTITDASGNASEARTVMRRATPTRAVGDACDLSGFNRCVGSVCAPSGGTQYVCTATSTARNAGCGAARVLHPPQVTSVVGELNAYSLWDVPSGCVANDPKRRPDSVVTLRLDAPAQTVVLSTNNATTTFDSQLYVLLDCTSDLPACINADCPCADDAPGSLQSELVLHDLDAGDYLIVIDSLPTPDSHSDAWELTVTVQ